LPLIESTLTLAMLAPLVAACSSGSNGGEPVGDGSVGNAGTAGGGGLGLWWPLPAPAALGEAPPVPLFVGFVSVASEPLCSSASSDAGADTVPSALSRTLTPPCCRTELKLAAVQMLALAGMEFSASSVGRDLRD